MSQSINPLIAAQAVAYHKGHENAARESAEQREKQLAVGRLLTQKKQQNQKNKTGEASGGFLA
jgi:hypothetical protein